MNTKAITAALSASVLAIVGAGAARAQPAAGPADSAWWRPSGLYGALGYSNVQTAQGPDVNLSAITGRLGARFGRYLGVEGEVSGGLGGDMSAFGADRVRTHLESQYAGYGVAYLPITAQFELLGRIGYGAQQARVRDLTALVSSENHYASVNYGGGAQYFFDPKDAVRFDYSRIDAQRDAQPDSDVFSLSFVRRF